jgi:hypothetical protein
MTAMRTRGILVLITAGTLLASCGGSSSSATAPSTPKQIAADKATIKAALLTADDVPLGYSGVPHEDSDDSDPPDAVVDAFVKCSGFPKRLVSSKTDNQPQADAPDFSKGKIGQGAATEIDSSIELDRSAKDVSDPLSQLSPNTAKCFEPLFRAAFKQSLGTDPTVSFGDVSVVPLTVGSVGDQAAAFKGQVNVSGTGLSIPIEFNLYFVRSGRAIVEMTALGYSTSFDKKLAEKLLGTMVDRLKAAKV